jgi:hypothetical protein
MYELHIHRKKIPVVYQIMFQDSVQTSQKILCFPITMNNGCLGKYKLFTLKITQDTFCEQNSDYLNVKKKMVYIVTITLYGVVYGFLADHSGRAV